VITDILTTIFIYETTSDTRGPSLPVTDFEQK